jgi:RimJ/RimL family protein N-acetyltransferase
VTPTIRRLSAAAAAEFQALRLEGFRLQEREFRYAPEDEADLPLAEAAARLERDFVVGAFDASGALVGVAGLAPQRGAKTRHKALLWGMYLRAAYRGGGAADGMMSALLGHARGRVEIVNLTVMAENRRAIRFYERWGFQTYGVEPAAVRAADGAYLDEAAMFLRLGRQGSGDIAERPRNA